MTAELEESLLLRTPLTVERLAYSGGDAAGFRRGYLGRNPQARIVTEPQDDAEAFDCCVVADGASANLAVWVARLAPGGFFVAGFGALSGAESSVLLEALTAAGLALRTAYPLEVRETFDDQAADQTSAIRNGAPCPAVVVVAQKPGPAPAPARVVVRTIAYSPYLMDIRTQLPATEMRSSPDMTVIYSTPPGTLPQVPPDQPKVLILQRPALADPNLLRSNLARIIHNGWISIIEYDDHPQPVADALGVDPNLHRFAYQHAIQTSTQSLIAVFRNWNPEVAVFPNAVFDLKPFREGPAPRRVVFGAFRRGQLAIEVMRSLETIPEEFPEVEFVVVGDRTIFDAIPADRKTFHPPVPYSDYLDLIGSCAISLSPISDFPQVETKSDTKFLDASARSVVTIASPPIYRQTIRHGETGLIAERVEDWRPLLAQVLRDDSMRRSLARGAWEYVRDHRMFRPQIAAREAWYRSLWARRDELNKALIGRVPGLAEAVANLN